MSSGPYRSKALVITRNLPPLIGGMERLVWHIVDELHADWRVHVIGPAGCAGHLPPEVSATEVPLRPMPRFLLRTLLAALRHALHLRPRLVLAGSGLTAPFAWLIARFSGARCVIYLHGLDIEARHPLYGLLWRPCFRHCDLVLVNSHFTQALACEAGIDPERIAVLHPGVELPDMHDAARQYTAFRERYGLGDAPLMLYVGRITARKGLAVFVREILPEIIAELPEARLVVIGDEPASALLQNKGELDRIKETLTANSLAERVLFSRALDDHELDAAYFAADVLVFPVQERRGDNEGFGMVALEGAAHGLPIVAFAAGGVPDAVADGRSGDLIAAGQNHAFAQAVLARLDSSPAGRGAGVREITGFAAGFAWPLFGRRLRTLCGTTQDKAI